MWPDLYHVVGTQMDTTTYFAGMPPYAGTLRAPHNEFLYKEGGGTAPESTVSCLLDESSLDTVDQLALYIAAAPPLVLSSWLLTD